MKRPIARAISWIANVRFYSRLKFKKSDFPEFQVEPTMLKIKKCLIWDPNLYHREAHSATLTGNSFRE